MKKRILYIARNIPTPNKKENQVILNIAKKLSSDFEIEMLYPKEIVPWGLHFLSKYKTLYNLKPWKWEDKTIQILSYIRVPNNANAFRFALQNQYLSKIKNKNYDLIHCHFIFPDGIFAHYFSQEWNVPFIITVRESDIDLLGKVSQNSSTWKWAENVLSDAKEILVLNNASTNFLKEHFKVKCTLLPHGINAKNILSNVPTHDEGSDIKISVVAAAIPTKQIDWVINAVKEYQGNKNIQLSIIGSGAQLNELKDLAKEQSNISFLGKIPHQEVFVHLKKSDIFALPSRKESFGLVYLEAAATGNAIIGYKNTGIYGVLEEGKEIIYIDDYDDFRNQLFFLIENKNAREQFNQNAWTKVKEYTWDKIISRYIKLYRNNLK